ncbi:MAG: DedA family protein [Gammaproteobacteria bacterium]|nr:DedA family protein [Gammaproteobacteria bacterium]
MRLFSTLYDKSLQWARHRHAATYLGALSFAESSFFPIPPDVMLAPMTLARRERAWFYALLTTIASVLGGIFGYFIGVYGMEAVTPWIKELGYWHHYEHAQSWFENWGFWAIFLAGFAPIPYKMFTISAGAASMAFFPFVIASLIGRGARFFLVSGLIYWGGEKMEQALRRHVDRIGWGLVIAVIIGYLLYTLYK